MSPETGPVGTTVSVEGTNLLAITALTFGSETIGAEAFGSQSSTTIVFDVPTGQRAGAKTVALLYGDGKSIDLGGFKVTKD